MKRKLVAVAPTATPPRYTGLSVADHRRIHQPQQRDGDVGENHREGKTPQRFIGSVEQHV